MALSMQEALRPRRRPMLAGDPLPGQGMPAAPAPTMSIPSAGGGQPYQNIGGEKGALAGNEDPSRGLPSFASFGDYLGDPTVQKEWGDIGKAAVAAIAPGGLALTAGKAIYDGVGGGNVGGGYSGGGVNANDLGASLAEGNTTGTFANGGIVMPQDIAGPNPPGPDPGTVGASPGEVILNPQQQQMMGPEAMARMVQALKATGARNIPR